MSYSLSQQRRRRLQEIEDNNDELQTRVEKLTNVSFSKMKTTTSTNSPPRKQQRSALAKSTSPTTTTTTTTTTAAAATTMTSGAVDGKETHNNDINIHENTNQKTSSSDKEWPTVRDLVGKFDKACADLEAAALSSSPKKESVLSASPPKRSHSVSNTSFNSPSVTPTRSKSVSSTGGSFRSQSYSNVMMMKGPMIASHKSSNLTKLLSNAASPVALATSDSLDEDSLDEMEVEGAFDDVTLDSSATRDLSLQQGENSADNTKEEVNFMPNVPKTEVRIKTEKNLEILTALEPSSTTVRSPLSSSLKKSSILSDSGKEDSPSPPVAKKRVSFVLDENERSKQSATANTKDEKTSKTLPDMAAEAKIPKRTSSLETLKVSSESTSTRNIASSNLLSHPSLETMADIKDEKFVWDVDSANDSTTNIIFDEAAIVNSPTTPQEHKVATSSRIAKTITESVSNENLRSTASLMKAEINDANDAARILFTLRPIDRVESVVLTGSFDNWSKSIHMNYDSEKDYWFVEILLDPTKEYQYKFVVDGNWVLDTSASHTVDEHGNENNLLRPTSDDTDVQASGELVRNFERPLNRSMESKSFDDLSARIPPSVKNIKSSRSWYGQTDTTSPESLNEEVSFEFTENDGSISDSSDESSENKNIPSQKIDDAQSSVPVEELSLMDLVGEEVRYQSGSEAVSLRRKTSNQSLQDDSSMSVENSVADTLLAERKNGFAFDKTGRLRHAAFDTTKRIIKRSSWTEADQGRRGRIQKRSSPDLSSRLNKRVSWLDSADSKSEGRTWPKLKKKPSWILGQGEEAVKVTEEIVDQSDNEDEGSPVGNIDPVWKSWSLPPSFKASESNEGEKVVTNIQVSDEKLTSDGVHSGESIHNDTRGVSTVKEIEKKSSGFFAGILSYVKQNFTESDEESSAPKISSLTKGESEILEKSVVPEADSVKKNAVGDSTASQVDSEKEPEKQDEDAAVQEATLVSETSDKVEDKAVIEDCSAVSDSNGVDVAAAIKEVTGIQNIEFKETAVSEDISKKLDEEEAPEESVYKEVDTQALENVVIDELDYGAVTELTAGDDSKEIDENTAVQDISVSSSSEKIDEIAATIKVITAKSESEEVDESNVLEGGSVCDFPKETDAALDINECSVITESNEASSNTATLRKVPASKFTEELDTAGQVSTVGEYQEVSQNVLVENCTTFNVSKEMNDAEIGSENCPVKESADADALQEEAVGSRSTEPYDTIEEGTEKSKEENMNTANENSSASISFQETDENLATNCEGADGSHKVVSKASLDLNADKDSISSSDESFTTKWEVLDDKRTSDEYIPGDSRQQPSDELEIVAEALSRSVEKKETTELYKMTESIVNEIVSGVVDSTALETVAEDIHSAPDTMEDEGKSHTMIIPEVKAGGADLEDSAASRESIVLENQKDTTSKHDIPEADSSSPSFLTDVLSVFSLSSTEVPETGAPISEELSRDCENVVVNEAKSSESVVVEKEAESKQTAAGMLTGWFSKLGSFSGGESRPDVVSNETPKETVSTVGQSLASAKIQDIDVKMSNTTSDEKLETYTSINAALVMQNVDADHLTVEKSNHVNANALASIEPSHNKLTSEIEEVSRIVEVDNEPDCENVIEDASAGNESKMAASEVEPVNVKVNSADEVAGVVNESPSMDPQSLASIIVEEILDDVKCKAVLSTSDEISVVKSETVSEKVVCKDAADSATSVLSDITRDILTDVTVTANIQEDEGKDVLLNRDDLVQAGEENEAYSTVSTDIREKHVSDSSVVNELGSVSDLAVVVDSVSSELSKPTATPAMSGSNFMNDIFSIVSNRSESAPTSPVENELQSTAKASLSKSVPSSPVKEFNPRVEEITSEKSHEERNFMSEVFSIVTSRKVSMPKPKIGNSSADVSEAQSKLEKVDEQLRAVTERSIDASEDGGVSKTTELEKSLLVETLLEKPTLGESSTFQDIGSVDDEHDDFSTYTDAAEIIPIEESIESTSKRGLDDIKTNSNLASKEADGINDETHSESHLVRDITINTTINSANLSREIVPDETLKVETSLNQNESPTETSNEVSEAKSFEATLPSSSFSVVVSRIKIVMTLFVYFQFLAVLAAFLLRIII